MGQRSDQLSDAEPGFVRRGDADEPDEALETAAVREEIEQTRADMSSTLEAIQEKLDPEALSEQAKDTSREVADHAIREAKAAAQEVADHAIAQAKEAVREMTDQARLALREATIGKVENMARTANDTAGGWRHTLVETIKEHPLPAAVAGLSLGWLFLNRSSAPARPPSGYTAARDYTGYQGGEYRRGYAGASSGSYPAERGGLSAAADQAQTTVGQVADRAQQVVGQVGDSAGSVVGQAQDTAGQVVSQVQDTAGQVVDTAQEQVSRAQGFLQQQLEENPLVVGAVAVAVGSVLAATMRPTPREDQVLGEARDRLVGGAKEFTQDTMQKVGRVVDEVQSTAKEEAQKQELVPKN